MSGMTEVPARPCGLRERKKARTRASIREHALRLFSEQGYSATTIEQITTAAEVSPATFFRYFPTKEDVVLQDDFDIITLEEVRAQPPELNPIAAFRAAAAAVRNRMTDEDMAEFTMTTRLTLMTPEVRARAIDELSRTTDVIAAAIADRLGRSPGDFAIRNMAGAIVGVIMTAAIPQYSAESDSAGAAEADQVWSRIDAALAHLEAGLPL
jgi:AcrR family transcriptional regulator